MPTGVGSQNDTRRYARTTITAMGGGTPSAVQADHRGLYNADTPENNSKLSQKLWDSVTGHDRNVYAVASSQEEEGQRQHVEADIEQRTQGWTMPAALQQCIPSFE
jgi:hypothetical protein